MFKSLNLKITKKHNFIAAYIQSLKHYLISKRQLNQRSPDECVNNFTTLLNNITLLCSTRYKSTPAATTMLFW